jgi:hypothetical protein
MLCLLALAGDRAKVVQERDHAPDRRKNRVFSQGAPNGSSEAREEPATACDDLFTVDCDARNQQTPAFSEADWPVNAPASHEWRPERDHAGYGSCWLSSCVRRRSVTRQAELPEWMVDG